MCRQSCAGPRRGRAFASDGLVLLKRKAVLKLVLRKVANHTIHESFTADTRDHEDHTFCGVMQEAQKFSTS